MKVIKLLILMFVFTSCASAQLPIPNTDVEINYWEVTFWKIDLGEGVLEVSTGDTITLAWDQPLSLASETQIEVVPPDSQRITSFLVYTYDVNLDVTSDTAFIEHRMYFLEVSPGDYCYSARTHTIDGRVSVYGEPFPFRVTSEYPIMYPVRIKILVR